MEELERQLEALRDNGVAREEAERVLSQTVLKNIRTALVPTRYWGVDQLLHRMSLKVLDKVYANESSQNR